MLAQEPLTMTSVPSDFTCESLTINDIYQRKYRGKNFHNSTYLGKLQIPKPESLDAEKFNMFEGCGSYCYVFGFPLWNILFSQYEKFWDEPGEIFRNIGSNNDFILVGENGIFVYTQRSFTENRFRRCMQSDTSLFRFMEYNSEERYWNFEYIKRYQSILLDKDKFWSFSRLSASEFDPSAPCPEEIWNKFSLLSIYRNKKVLGPEIPISAKTREIVSYFTKNSIISAKKLETFHFTLFSENIWSDPNPFMKIYELNATSLVFNNEPDPTQFSAIYINDFLKFGSDNKMTREPEMWLFDPNLAGYCCGSQDYFYRIAFEKRLKLLRGFVFDVRNEIIYVKVNNLNIEKVIEIPSAETEYADKIEEAFKHSKLATVEVLFFFNGVEDKYKITKYEIS